MTELELFDALSYAGVAQQTEVTDATVAVYFDQLKLYEAETVFSAVRRWVSNGGDAYRRLPTVNELKILMQCRRRRLSPEVERVCNLTFVVKEARRIGKSQAEVDDLIERFERES